MTLGSFQVLQGIKLQQLSLLVGGLIAGCALLLAEGYLALAGILLASATIKPQLVLPLAAWLLLWTFSDWRRRQNLMWGFVSTMGVLFAGAEYVLPGWIGRFRGAITAYRQYNDGARSVLDVLITPEWGRVLAGLIVLALAVTGWKFRRASTDSPVFNVVLGLVLATTVVILPKAAPYNQILLLPASLIVARHWQTLWQKNLISRLLLLVCGLLIFWPWLATTALTIASLGLPPDIVQKAWACPAVDEHGHSSQRAHAADVGPRRSSLCQILTRPPPALTEPDQILERLNLHSLAARDRLLGHWRLAEDRMTLKIETRQADGVTIVSCQGRIMFGEEATTLREDLKRVLASSRQIVLNLAGVNYIDSGGLGTLVGVYSSARASGAEIKLTGLGQRLRDVLQITKLVTVFEVYDTEQEAIATFHRGAA